MSVKLETSNRPTNREEAKALGLTPWEPGKSGNPKGRPKGKTPYRMVMEACRDDDSGLLQELTDVFISALKAGDPAFWRLFLERSDPAKLDATLTMPQLLEGIALAPRVVEHSVSPTGMDASTPQRALDDGGPIPTDGTAQQEEGGEQEEATGTSEPCSESSGENTGETVLPTETPAPPGVEPPRPSRLSNGPGASLLR